MTLAGQDTSTRHAQAAMLAHHGHLRRNHLRLKRGCQLLRLHEPKAKFGYPSLFIALEACNLHFRRYPSRQLRHQLHPPRQLRHQPPSSREP
jgi:hypothetical protein